MRLAVVLLLVAGCSQRAAAPSTENTSPTHVTSGPAPSVAVEGEDVMASGLPAVSADGAVIAAPHRGEDGARAWRNFKVVAVSREDQVLHEHVLIALPDGAADEPALPGPGEVDAFNRQLAEIHAERGLTPMSAAEVTSEDNESFRAAVGGVEITVDGDAAVTVKVDGAPVVERVFEGWRVAPETHGSGADAIQCESPVRLVAAYVSRDHRVAALRVGYHGTDTCWEPDSAWHAVAW